MWFVVCGWSAFAFVMNDFIRLTIYVTLIPHFGFIQYWQLAVKTVFHILPAMFKNTLLLDVLLSLNPDGDLVYMIIHGKFFKAFFILYLRSKTPDNILNH